MHICDDCSYLFFVDMCWCCALFALSKCGGRWTPSQPSKHYPIRGGGGGSSALWVLLSKCGAEVPSLLFIVLWLEIFVWGPDLSVSALHNLLPFFPIAVPTAFLAWSATYYGIVRQDVTAINWRSVNNFLAIWAPRELQSISHAGFCLGPFYIRALSAQLPRLERFYGKCTGCFVSVNTSLFPQNASSRTIRVESFKTR